MEQIGELLKPRMSPADKLFFQKLGARIAALRKERGLTQVQLAEVLGCSQQRLQAFEKGARRMPLSEFPRYAKALGVSAEELLGTQAGPGKRGPAPKLQRQLERLLDLPKSQQRVVSHMIDGVLQQAGR